jgi:hypothetical protein
MENEWNGEWEAYKTRMFVLEKNISQLSWDFKHLIHAMRHMIKDLPKDDY